MEKHMNNKAAMQKGTAEKERLKQGNELLENLVPISEVPNRISNKISEKTLRNWRVKGMYPQMYVKLGGKVFVDISEIYRIIQAQKDQAYEQSRRLGL